MAQDAYSNGQNVTTVPLCRVAVFGILQHMAKIRKATDAEKASAAAEQYRCYPLYGYVKHRSGVELEVEELNDRDNDIKYEVLAPAGQHFYPDGLHTLLCSNQKDVFQRIAQDLVPCGEDC